jgi:uncharacterized protein (DUF1501 family)
MSNPKSNWRVPEGSQQLAQIFDNNSGVAAALQLLEHKDKHSIVELDMAEGWDFHLSQTPGQSVLINSAQGIALYQEQNHTWLDGTEELVLVFTPGPVIVICTSDRQARLFLATPRIVS